MGTCPKCQNTFDAETKFCPNDGATIPHTPPPHATHKPSSMPNLPPLPPAPEVGWIIDGKYRLEKKMGEGGMGTVWKAVHNFMNKPVALKLLRPQIASSEEAIKRFAREAKLASQLDEPHCVTLFDCGRDEKSNTLYLAMEYLEGRSLRALIDAERRIPVDQAVRLLCQLLAALGAAHERGIVHRDVKPENIFLVSVGKRKDFVKLLDFGIAKQPPTEDYKTQITRAGFTVGTPEYISPEQAFAKEVDGRADLYAAGIIFYELIVGRRPFVGDNALSIITAHVQQEPPNPRKTAPDANISEAIERVLLKSIAKEADDRYPDAGAFAAALQEALPSAITASTIAPARPIPAVAPNHENQINTIQTAAFPPTPTWMRPAFYGLLVLSGLLLLGFLVVLLSPANAQSPKKTPPKAPALTEPDTAAAEAALAKKKPDEALRLLSKLEPKTPKVHALLATAYAQQSSWKSAKEEFLLAPDAAQVEPLLSLALTSISQNKNIPEATSFVAEGLGEAAVLGIKAAMKDPLQRAAAITLLGAFAKEPQVAGYLVNALGGSTECNDRVRLVNALAQGPKNDAAIIGQLEKAASRKDLMKECSASGLPDSIKTALQKLKG